jgi:hypothetical protein
VRFRIEQHFPGPLVAVEDAFLDPGFLRHLGTLPKLGDPQLVHRVDAGDLVHLWVRYRFTGDVSAAVRRVVDPQRLTWVEESTLDRRTHRTTWAIRPDNYGGLLRCSGTFQLEPVEGAPETTRRVAEGELKVSVPMVGGKVASAIVSGLKEHAALEEQAMADWLGDAREGSR